MLLIKGLHYPAMIRRSVIQSMIQLEFTAQAGPHIGPPGSRLLLRNLNQVTIMGIYYRN